MRHIAKDSKIGGEIIMEKERSSKVITIVALCIAVIGLSVGFAVFSNSLVINSSANVNPSSSAFNVDFSSSSTSVSTTSVTPTKSPTSLTAGSATISNSGNPTVSGLTVTFTEPGQSVVYTFYAHNTGAYIAYLNSITYGNASGGSSFKTCTAGSGTTASLVTAACDDITVSVKVGSDSAVTSTKSGISNHTLAIGANETVIVTIAYASGGDRADGDFTVNFGNISLLYSSAD